MSEVFFSKGQKWYRFLSNPDKKNLFEDIKRSPDKFIICLETEGQRLYTYFNNYLDFVNYSMDHKACWHEVCPGDKMLKMFFDIDVSEEILPEFSERNFFDFLFNVIIRTFAIEYSVNLDPKKDFILLDSCGPEKKSWHLIIDNYCLRDMKEAHFLSKKIKGEIIKKVKENLDFIDWGVYINNKTLRVLASEKNGRILKLRNTFVFEGQEIIHLWPEDNLMLHYEASLLTVTGHCSLLPPKVLTDPKEKTYAELEIPEEIKNSVLPALCKYLNLDEIPFKVTKTVGSIICFQRIRPSYCPICRRNHDAENIFLMFKDRGDHYDLFYNCRRNSTTSELVSRFPKKDCLYEIPGVSESNKKLNLV